MSSSERNQAIRGIGQPEVASVVRRALRNTAIAELMALLLMDVIILLILYQYKLLAKTAVLQFLLYQYQLLRNIAICHVITLFFIALGIRMYSLYRQLIMLGRAQVAAERRVRVVEEWQQVPQSRRAFDVGMSDNLINALPAYKYKPKTHGLSASHLNSTREGSPIHQASSSAAVVNETIEDKLNCTVCIHEVNSGELVRCLPCSHEFHATCIDMWLRLRGECPICRSSASLGMQQHGEGEGEGEGYASVVI